MVFTYTTPQRYENIELMLQADSIICDNPSMSTQLRNRCKNRGSLMKSLMILFSQQRTDKSATEL